MTFFELASYSRYIRRQDERQWWQTSSLMALHANMNRDSKKKPNPYKAADFFPYNDERKKAKFVRGLTTEEKDLTAGWAQKLQSQDGKSGTK